MGARKVSEGINSGPLFAKRCLSTYFTTCKCGVHQERWSNPKVPKGQVEFRKIENDFFFFNLFLAVLGLRFCARAFSSCGKQGPLLIAVHGPLTVVASLVAEHRLQTRRLSSCGLRAQLLRGMWDLPENSF